MKSFDYKTQTKIVRDKEAYLLHELLKDAKHLSAEQDLETSVILHTSSLKIHLLKEFPDEMAFFPSGKYLLVHPTDINPCSYSVATLHGYGLRDADLAKAFGRIIRRKLQERETSDNAWPLTPEELLAELDTGPLPEIYNFIFYSIYDRATINNYNVRGRWQRDGHAHVHAHADANAYIYAKRLKHTHAYTQAHAHAHTHTHSHTHSHTRAHRDTHAHPHAHAHVQELAHAHRRTLLHMHTRTYTTCTLPHAHAHTHK